MGERLSFLSRSVIVGLCLAILATSFSTWAEIDVFNAAGTPVRGVLLSSGALMLTGWIGGLAWHGTVLPNAAVVVGMIPLGLLTIGGLTRFKWFRAVAALWCASCTAFMGVLVQHVLLEGTLRIPLAATAVCMAGLLVMFALGLRGRSPDAEADEAARL